MIDRRTFADVMTLNHNDCIQGYNRNMTFDIRVISSSCTDIPHQIHVIQCKVKQIPPFGIYIKKKKVMFHLIMNIL